MREFTAFCSLESHCSRAFLPVRPQQATDVFEVSEDGRKMQIVTVLDEGTEYELVKRMAARKGASFDSQDDLDVPVRWAGISCRDRNGTVRQGWPVMNPDAISGIPVGAFDDDSSGECNACANPSH